MKKRIPLLILLLFVLLSSNAYAYLDPGSGSLFAQMIIAALTAIPLTVKYFWHRLFPKRKPKHRS